jgi:hypothetical protein
MSDMKTYRSPEERQAWAAYGEATDRRRRWYVPTLAAVVALGVLSVTTQLTLGLGWWGFLLAPVPFLPHVVWRLTAVQAEKQAGDRWDRIVGGEQVEATDG